MSSETDSDEFFDAEDTTPVRAVRLKGKHNQDYEDSQILNRPEDNDNLLIKATESQWSSDLPVLHVTSEDLKEVERKAKENERRRRKVEEMRRRMLTDNDEVAEVSSDQSSVTSSAEGIYVSGHLMVCVKPGNKPTVSDDDQSVISLGKVGSILGGASTDSRDCNMVDSSHHQTSVPESLVELSLDSCDNAQENKTVHCSEPDVVASTKVDRSNEVPPVAPPRKKKHKKRPPSTLESSDSLLSIEKPQGLPSPTAAVENLARELEYSLDLHSAIKGQYVVKPQDREQDRAEGPPIVSTEQSTSAKKESLERLTTSLNDQTSSLDSKFLSTSIEDSIHQLNMVMRTRSDSGRFLSDLEILEQVTVLNLDTGERVPLSLAEEHLPQGINPLSLHIMRLTSEYVSNSALNKDRESDDESVDSKKLNAQSDTADAGNVKRKTAKLRKMIGRQLQSTVEKTVNIIKTVADEVYHSRHNDDFDTSEEELSADARTVLKVKASSSHKGPAEFDGIRVVQVLRGERSGAIWTMKFSSCGRLLATAGQDRVLQIWVLRDAYSIFDDMRQKYNAEAKVSPTPSQESLASQQSGDDTNKNGDVESEDTKGPFMSKPFCVYEGHTADLLDVSWSKNYFILSSSMDKTVRLWHISRKECLCCFQHIDFVTAIAFHPRDDRYFLSGSLDGKLRLWNIPDKKVALWNELDGQTKLITAISFCQNGKFAVVGSYDGRCIFYNTEQLKYYTQIHVRSTRGKNAQGRKISGIEPMPGEDKILVTSNDSRIRLYDLRDLSLSCKYKGYANLSSQIRASFSHDGKYIISGSENQFIYIWKTHHDYSKFSSARRDRNDYWEGIKAHNAVVTSAVFAPNPSLILKQLDQCEQPVVSSTVPVAEVETTNGYVVVSADFSGAIKVFVHKPKSKSSALAVLPSSLAH